MKAEGRGWILFSMIVLLTAGIMRIFDGIWMIHNSNNLPPALQGYSGSLQGSLFGSSLKTYGWIYLIVGVVLILAALALSGGSELARWIGVFAGMVLAISSIWWIEYAPIWSLMYVGIGISVIYGLVVFGGTEAPATE